jgi:hypothetical protein
VGGRLHFLAFFIARDLLFWLTTLLLLLLICISAMLVVFPDLISYLVKSLV